MSDSASTSDVFFLRVKHLKNNEGSLHLNDVSSEDQQYNQHFKIPAYIPYGEVVDIPLTDAVLLSYHRGAVRNLINRNLVEAFVLYNDTVVTVTTSPTTIAPGQNVVLVDTSAGDVTLTLPLIEMVGSSNEFVVKKITSDANSVHLEAQENDELESDTIAFSMNDPFGALTLRSSEAGWWLTAQYPAGEGGGSGGGGGRRDYMFANSMAVPKNSGILYLESDGVATSSVPLVINRESSFAGASIKVNEPSTDDYALEVLLNDVVTETLTLPAGQEAISSNDLSANISANDRVALRIVRTSGNSKSSFSKMRATLEMTEQ